MANPLLDAPQESFWRGGRSYFEEASPFQASRLGEFKRGFASLTLLPLPPMTIGEGGRGIGYETIAVLFDRVSPEALS